MTDCQKIEFGCGGWLRRVGRISTSRDGVAALEFAFSIPLLLLAMVGGFNLIEATAIYRKLTDATIQTANVAAQYTSMMASDAQAVMANTSQIMSPYSTAGLQMTLSIISTNANNAAYVTWSQAYNGATPFSKGAVFTLPHNLSRANMNYIVVKSKYTSSSIGVSNALFNNLNVSIVVIPRQSPSINCTVPGSTLCP